VSRRVALPRVAAAVVALGLVWAAAALTRAPVLLHGDDEALVRLSWRMDGAVLRDCRPVTDEERARMPAHMAREEICEERIVPYRLTVRLDGREILDREVRPRGARADRPLSVFHEVPAAVGEHRVQVRFQPAAEWGPGGQDHPDLPRLELDTALVLGIRDVGLITYDRDRATLRLRTPGPGRSPGTTSSSEPPEAGNP
jgi:hypothetical protein